MKNLKYSYRLYPNKEQSVLLNQFCGAQRWVWNHFLNLERKEYQATQKFRFSHKNITSLPQLKKDIETEWLSTIPSTSLQQTLRHLNDAILSGSRKQKGFPKFKSKKFHTGSFSLTMVSKKSITGDHFKMPKIGPIKINLHRELPSDFKSCVVKQKAGKWYVVFTVKVKKQPKVSDIKDVVGIDLNSKDLVVSSDGEVISNPKFYAKAKQRIKIENKKLSRKVKGSSNWIKQVLRLQRAYDHMTKQRTDYLHKVSSQLVNSNDMICVEDLNVAGMSKFNGSMVQDAGWSQLVSMIEYKCDLYGKHFIKIDRWFPSTQMCNECGAIVKKAISERTHKCDCGCEMPRDLNSAINIRNEGINRAGIVRIEACGDITDGGIGVNLVSSYMPMKQEAANALA